MNEPARAVEAVKLLRLPRHKLFLSLCWKHNTYWGNLERVIPLWNVIPGLKSEITSNTGGKLHV